MTDGADKATDRAAKARERTRTWYSNPENAARQKARQQAAKEANPEAVKAKQREYSANWRERNPERRRVTWIRHKYQMTREQVERLLEVRDLCECCGIEKATVIDHDHATMKFRGQLCHGCNSAAGMVKDDPARARALSDYLTRTKG